MRRRLWDLWNRVATPALNRDHGEVVTNGAMKPPLQIGFDWKFNTAPEHLIAFHGPELGVALDLNGKEPETLDLLRQPLPVAAGQRYELRWQAHTTHPARLFWLLTSGDADTPVRTCRGGS